jgi:hypothetical protein
MPGGSRRGTRETASDLQPRVSRHGKNRRVSQVRLVIEDVLGFGVQPIGVTVDDLQISLIGETARTSGKTLAQKPLNRFGAAFALLGRSFEYLQYAL